MEAYPPPLSAEQLQKLKSTAFDYASCHGLVMKDKVSQSIVHAPVALFPSPFPATCLEEAYALQPLFNNLVDVLAQQTEFLKESLAKVSQMDEFTGRLLSLFLKVSAEENRQVIL